MPSSDEPASCFVPWTMGRTGPIALPVRALLERGQINERQYKGLLYAREHGTIARQAYAQLTGAPERTATRDLADLVAKRLLEVAGGRGWRTAYRPRDEHP